MKFKTILLIMLLSILLMFSSGCDSTDDSNVDNPDNGSTTDDVTNAVDDNDADIVDESSDEEDFYYNGVWTLISDTDLPFYYLDTQDDTIVCFDENTRVLDYGTMNYDKERAAQGGPEIIFTFDNIGEFGASFKGSADIADDKYMYITNMFDWSADVEVSEMHYQFSGTFYTSWYNIASPELYDDIPFYYLEIQKGNGRVFCFNENIEYVDSGTFEFNDDVYTFYFENLGDYTSTTDENLHGNEWMDLTKLDEDGDIFKFNFLQSPQKISGNHYGKESSEILLDALGNLAEGKSIVVGDAKIINGFECETFSFGTNSDDKFLTEKHYAVSNHGKIYELDVASDKWIEFIAE